MPPPDPFDTLGVPPTFDLTPAQLRTAFLARSGQLHPDVAAGAESEAAALNEAKRALDDPESRAEALLARLGGPAKHQDRSLPPAFLQEMLEIREQIDASRATPGGVEQWERWAAERRSQHIESVAYLFRNMDPGRPDESALRAVRRELNMWRYVERLIEQLDSGGEGI
jgi:curved DNA-binding protein CbpA